MVGRLNDLEVARLEEFLFGASRISLTAVREPLVDLQEGGCFYCGGPLRRSAEVDHFLPWSHHRRCNSAKRDFLAGAGHLRRWRERSDDRGDRLQVIAGQAGWPRDRERTLGAVRGIYLRLPEGVALWRGGREFEEARHGELAAALGMG